MSAPATRPQSAEFLRFVLTGGMAAGVNIGSRVALGWFMPFQASIVVAYLLGMTTAFLLARALVFAPAERSAAAQYGRFALVNAAALLQVWLVSVGLDRWLLPAFGMTWHPETVAHVVGVLSPVVASYYGHKHFSFRKPEWREPAAAPAPALDPRP